MCRHCQPDIGSGKYGHISWSPEGHMKLQQINSCKNCAGALLKSNKSCLLWIIGRQIVMILTYLAVLLILGVTLLIVDWRTLFEFSISDNSHRKLPTFLTFYLTSLKQREMDLTSVFYTFNCVNLVLRMISK